MVTRDIVLSPVLWLKIWYYIAFILLFKKPL
jgi:hypothetical protein